MMSDVIRFWGPVLLIVVVLVIISVILMRRYKNYSISIYIPTLMLWLISFALFVYAIFFAKPMQDLSYMVMSLMTGVLTFIAWVVTMVIDTYKKRKRK